MTSQNQFLSFFFRFWSSEGVNIDHFLSQKTGFWDFFKVLEFFKKYFGIVFGL